MKKEFTLYEAALLIRDRLYVKGCKERDLHDQAKSEEVKRLHHSRASEYFDAMNRVAELYNDGDLEFSEEGKMARKEVKVFLVISEHPNLENVRLVLAKNQKRAKDILFKECGVDPLEHELTEIPLNEGEDLVFLREKDPQQ